VFSRKMSAGSARSKMPRRLTQGPRLVETVTSGEVVTMRSASAVSLAAMSPKILPKASWSTAGRLGGPAGSTAPLPQGIRAGAGGSRERHAVEEFAEPLRWYAEAGKRLPLGAVGHRHAAPERGDLVEILSAPRCCPCARQGQPVTLDRIGDKAGRPVVLNRLERGQDRSHFVAGEIGHQPLQRGVVMVVEDRADHGMAVEIAPEGARASPRRACRPMPNRASTRRRRSTRLSGPAKAVSREPPVYHLPSDLLIPAPDWA